MGFPEPFLLERAFKMKDCLRKYLIYDEEIRLYLIQGRGMVQTAQANHQTWPTATAALGRTLLGATLMGASYKGEDYLTVRINGGGPLGMILVSSDSQGHAKGYVQNPQVSLPPNDQGKLDVRSAVGQEGIFSVTKDLQLKEPFEGRVPIVSGEIAEDFTYYMAVSEQTPSSFGLSVLVNPDGSVAEAGGFMVQVLPGASQETISSLEEAIAKLPALHDIFTDQADPLNYLLESLAQGGQTKFLQEMPVSFYCDCSKERFEKALISLPSQEIQAMIEEDDGAEAVCHFCGKSYQFTAEDLDLILAEQ